PPPDTAPARRRTPGHHCAPPATTSDKDLSMTVLALLFGLLCGAISAALTWDHTHNPTLTGLAGLIITLLAWILGIYAIAYFTDD
uniref:hypothetical protein n=1 Tax=Nocardia suismassiliense TaxID=2077092 RepID=UPI001F231FBA